MFHMIGTGTARHIGASTVSLIVGLMTLLLLGLAGSAAGCGGNGEAVDAQAVLRDTSASMKAIEGFRFEYTVEQPEQAEPPQGLSIRGIAGEVSADGAMRAVVKVSQSGILLELEFVAVGDTHYLQDPLSKKWQSIAASMSPVGPLNLNTGTIQIIDQITEAVYVGRENIGGVSTYRIKGVVTADELAAISGAVTVAGTFPCELWIGVDDRLLRKVTVAGPAQIEEPPSISRTIILSELDTTFDISAPE